MAKQSQHFWQNTSMEDMSPAQWESLCDGCGKCCLGMVDDPSGNGALLHTAVACRLLDPDTCRCASYDDRHRYVPDCVRLTPTKVRTLPWLPSTCAYRLVADGKDLFPWHPLISGDNDSVHSAGQSVRGRTLSERDVKNPADHIADWPS